MWVGKIRMNGKNALIGGLCHKHSISASGYPLSTRWKGDSIYLNFTLFTFGKSENIESFFEDLKKCKRMIGFERRGHIFLGYLKESKKLSSLYNPNVFHVQPVLFNIDGSEIWHVSSWDKEELISFSKTVEKHYGGELLKITEENVSNLSIITLNPELTSKQKEAIEFAIKQGYYEVPRNAELTELADLMGVSYSTYQAHLRKAERKLIPFLFDKSHSDIYR
jgi:predicted DNA binding protein